MNLQQLSILIKEVCTDLKFTLFEIGARPGGPEPEVFYQILDIFPGSKLHGFEVDPKVCSELNQSAKSSLVYHPIALGLKDEQRPFFITNFDMCCSLYEPNQIFIDTYQELHYQNLREIIQITTTSLDKFAEENRIECIDFIKIDIQGAELDVFRGGQTALSNTLTIVSEVEFVELYKDQPLFGDVSSFLLQQGFMFHKFLGVAGRSIKPVVINNESTKGSQLMWGDAMFIKDIKNLKDLNNQALFKLSVLGYLYESIDLTYHCFDLVDSRIGSNLAEKFINLIKR